jgi:hypothetical protein
MIQKISKRNHTLVFIGIPGGILLKLWFHRGHTMVLKILDTETGWFGGSLGT